MLKLFFQITLFAVFALSACISVPGEHLTLSHRGYISVVQDGRDCDIVQFEKISNSELSQKPELDSNGFKMMTWNILKGMKEGWKEDFKSLIKYKDILTIQEAYLTYDLRELLKKESYNWDISIAFKYNGAEVGVLTASRLEPTFTCSFRIKEPLINIPKTALLTLYSLSNTDKSLMVVNIHSINFTLGTESFYTQLQNVEKILIQHHGPVIFSGDFNTWNKKRKAIVRDLSIRIGLKAVTFNKNYRSKVFGHDIDYIYYRGLTVSDATVLKVNSSDHNPMLVSFRLEEAR